ncbi:MAG: hypothetical protein GQ547_01275 [Methylophaga sp.]|nr:hypothetical protein [Methylophaga sp.]
MKKSRTVIITLLLISLFITPLMVSTPANAGVGKMLFGFGVGSYLGKKAIKKLIRVAMKKAPSFAKKAALGFITIQVLKSDTVYETFLGFMTMLERTAPNNQWKKDYSEFKYQISAYRQAIISSVAFKDSPLAIREKANFAGLKRLKDNADVEWFHSHDDNWFNQHDNNWFSSKKVVSGEHWLAESEAGWPLKRHEKLFWMRAGRNQSFLNNFDQGNQKRIKAGHAPKAASGEKFKLEYFDKTRGNQVTRRSERIENFDIKNLRVIVPRLEITEEEMVKQTKYLVRADSHTPIIESFLKHTPVIGKLPDLGSNTWGYMKRKYMPLPDKPAKDMGDGWTVDWENAVPIN